MFTNIEEAARTIVEFSEQNHEKRSVIVILSEETPDDKVQTIVGVSGKGGQLKGSIASALAQDKKLRNLFLEGVSRSLAHLIIDGETKGEESETKESKEEK